MTKIGRNQPCPCGSGKKYKKCHGRFAEPAPPGLAAAGTAFRRAHEAREILRSRAEGHGRPVISMDHEGYRFVAVGKRLYYGKNWRFFTDFLLHHMKDVLGRGWGQRMLKAGTSHPIFVWLKKLNDLRDQGSAETGIVQGNGEAFVAAVFRFAYALYLIAHHDAVPAALVRRLRQPREFRAAALETIVVAAFALAGFKIEMGEIRKGNTPEGEFKATSATTGRFFNIEAKRKNGWTNAVDLKSDAFRNELKLWIQRKLYLAARKNLENPIYWLELSISELTAQSEVEELLTVVREGLREAESSIRIGGEVPAPGYVFVTSHAYLTEDGAKDSTFFILEGFHIPMPKKGDEIEIEEAMVQRDRDRDIAWVLECLQKVQMVPHGFDGMPDELVRPDKATVDRLQVGQPLQIELSGPTSFTGLVMDVVSHGAEATAIVRNEATAKQHVVTVPLTEEEQKAAEALGDVVFGSPNPTRKVPENDPLVFYDWLLEVYAPTPRAKLLELLAPHLQFERYKDLPTEELRTRLCREWAKSIIGEHEAKRRRADCPVNHETASLIEK
jgi:hypothetical protein